MNLPTALQIAARIWCDKEYSHVAMDVDAAVRIANILIDVYESQRPVDTAFVSSKKVMMEPSFYDELVSLINRHGIDNTTDTPDFLVASYLESCITSLSRVVEMRDKRAGRQTLAHQISSTS